MNGKRLISWIKLYGIIPLTVLLFVCAFPPIDFPELAFAFAVPYLVWANRNSSSRHLLISASAISYFSWLILGVWLRHVSWLGWIILPIYPALYTGSWLYIAGRSMRVLAQSSFAKRILIVAGLAGLWVVFEWIKTFLFSGLPWLPLAGSQWQRPVMLQVASYVGYYGVSFILVFFNIAVASYFIGIVCRLKEEQSISGVRPTRCFEFYMALLILFGTIVGYGSNLPKPENQEYMFSAGIVQPNVRPDLKWDPDASRDNLIALRDESFKLVPFNPDVIIWPETALPHCINEPCWAKRWTEALVREAGVPFLVGALGEFSQLFFDAIYVVYPESGVTENYYQKRHLVPFGEYVPFRKWIPFLDKVVPMDFDLIGGTSDEPIEVSFGSKTFNVGGLICYEDIFPALARSSVKAGADLFLVITNDGWFGEEGGAYQHAVHSVLTAVQTRRPVIRCGNNGWSGWIDEYGRIREHAVDGNDSIYFRGSALFELYRDLAWVNKQSSYTQHGDWFVGACGILFVLGVINVRRP